MSLLDVTSSGQYFKQTANIDLSNESWTPFGFGGYFDGNGMTISNVKIDLSNWKYVGFFSELSSGGELKNVRLENVDIKGESYVGGLVGYTKPNSSISNSYASGNVTGAAYHVGGLVGFAEGNISNSYTSSSVSGSNDVGGLVGLAIGSISNSYATGSISGSYSVGGLVGDAAFTSSISNSYALGNVTGAADSDYVGGLVGKAYGLISYSHALGSVTGSSSVGGLVGISFSNIYNSYASGNVTGVNSVGGFVGSANSNSIIYNTYSSGSVTGSLNVGGFMGFINVNSNISISNSYYDREITNLPDNKKGIPRTTTEMKTGTPSETIYTGWDPAIWNFGDDTDYPTLKK